MVLGSGNETTVYSTKFQIFEGLDVKGSLEGCPQELGGVHFETMIECHVALYVHTIVQKWNS